MLSVITGLVPLESEIIDTIQRESEISFPALLRRLDAIEGNYVIRFMSSHPKDATKELIDTMLASEHIEHHLHLPVQSGSNAVLKAMNRHYTVEKYLEPGWSAAVAYEVMRTSEVLGDAGP